ncbi:MAG: DUF2281 domain-containing protein [Oscillospiraceae bacterium]|nr:DUF2281 domain-containing protein [Oscillospiraceae bacterium]
MYTIKAVYDGKSFKPVQPIPMAIPIRENYEMFITISEPFQKDPVNIGQSAKLPRSTARGLLKGKVWMSKDFNEPLDEMKEYME